MKSKKAAAKAPLTTGDADLRRDGLRTMLRSRQRELQGDVHTRLRDGRSHRDLSVRDQLEDSDANSQGDIDLALLQMRTELLARLDEALSRLDAGHYGSCMECGRDVSERRLRALPFAVRCHTCEEHREEGAGRLAHQYADPTPFARVN